MCIRDRANLDAIGISVTLNPMETATLKAECVEGNQELFLWRWNEDSKVDFVSVSYTHLDVYKRQEHPKEGSYTNYLFDKGVDKILKKVGEEATEIVIAAKNPDSDELKYEISDFLYHVMVLMAEQGLSWKDITRAVSYTHLDVYKRQGQQNTGTF